MLPLFAMFLVVLALLLMTLASFGVPMGRFNPWYGGWTLLVLAWLLLHASATGIHA
jgi:hypothetical protein